MCWFKKKKKQEPINSKYIIGERVNFKYRDDMRTGYIYNIKKDLNEEVIYDIQVGGECPSILYDIKEIDIKWPIKK